ncbi:MAG: SRPBCC domain-containing protein [Deltaproteobacteria bacterium]|nr:SRPBCC domain-containing protein [Deltaproteobacteria bacterium]
MAAKKKAANKKAAKKRGGGAKKRGGGAKKRGGGAKKKAAKKKAAPKKAAPKKAAPKKAAPKKAAPKKAGASGARPTTTIVQHVFIQATPLQVYDALVDPSVASTVIGGACKGAPTVGGAFTHWNDYIHGKHLELVRGERIVQEWATTEWPKGAAPSRLEISLAGTGGGTELTMTHSSVPTDQAEEYRQGWIDYYWTPMRAHFGG